MCGKGSPSFSDKINCQDQEAEAEELIPFQGLIFEKDEHENGENYLSDDFLDDFDLEQGEWPAVFAVTDFVGGHHEAILEKCDQPTGDDEAQQACFLKKFEVLKF